MKRVRRGFGMARGPWLVGVGLVGAFALQVVDTREAFAAEENAEQNLDAGSISPTDTRGDASAGAPDGGSTPPTEPITPAIDGGSVVPPPNGAAGPYTVEMGGALGDLSLEELLDVKVVTASLEAKSVAATPAVVTVITADDFRRYQYTSVADALQYVAGMDVLNDYVSPNVGVRGINGGPNGQSDVIKTMIGGMNIGFRPTTGALLGPELMPLDAIQQVEVIRGPASALYGANAFLGVVNIIPVQAKDLGPAGGRVSASLLDTEGNLGTRVNAMTWGTPLNIDSVVAVSAQETSWRGLSLPPTSPFYTNLSATLPSLTTRTDDDRSATAYARFEHKLGSDGSLALDFNGQFFDRGNDFNPEVSPLGGSVESFYNGMLRLQLKEAFGDSIQVNAFVAYSQGGPTSLERLIDTSPFRAEYSYLQQTLGYSSIEGRAEVRFAPPSLPLTLTGGADFVWDDEQMPSLTGISAHQPPQVLPPEPTETTISLTDPGVFLQGTLDLFKSLGVIAGARYEAPSNYSGQFSYRGGLVYSFTPKIAAKLLTGRSFKAPSPAILYGVPTVVGGWGGNPDLQAQTAETTELNFSGQLLSWLNVSATGYYTHIDNLAEITIATSVPEAQNVAAIDAWGGEFEVRVVPIAHLDLFANLSLVRTIRASTEIETLTGPVSSEAPAYPAAMGALGGTYEIPQARLRIVTVLEVRGPRLSDTIKSAFKGSQYYLPGYPLWSGGVSTLGLHVLGNHETRLGLRITNILNRSYTEPGTLGIDIPGEKIGGMVTVEQQF